MIVIILFFIICFKLITNFIMAKKGTGRGRGRPAKRRGRGRKI
jgi:hypothetical protein